MAGLGKSDLGEVGSLPAVQPNSLEDSCRHRCSLCYIFIPFYTLNMENIVRKAFRARI